MTSAERKIAQFLQEARATERGLTKALESQIAETPGGAYRRELQLHLRQTREHAHHLRKRLERLGAGKSSIERLVGSVMGRGVAIAMFPLGLLRSSESASEKVLRSAQDACAAEARGIATYSSMERLARRAGDDETAELAHAICEHQLEMLARMQAQMPPLTDALVAADIAVDVNHRNVADVEHETASRS